MLRGRRGCQRQGLTSIVISSKKSDVIKSTGSEQKEIKIMGKYVTSGKDKNVERFGDKVNTAVDPRREKRSVVDVKQLLIGDSFSKSFECNEKENRLECPGCVALMNKLDSLERNLMKEKAVNEEVNDRLRAEIDAELRKLRRENDRLEKNRLDLEAIGTNIKEKMGKLERRLRDFETQAEEKLEKVEKSMDKLENGPLF